MIVGTHHALVRASRHAPDPPHPVPAPATGSRPDPSGDAAELVVHPAAGYDVAALLDVIAASPAARLTIRYPGAQVGWFAELVTRSGGRVVHRRSELFLRHRVPVGRPDTGPTGGGPSVSPATATDLDRIDGPLVWETSGGDRRPVDTPSALLPSLFDAAELVTVGPPGAGHDPAGAPWAVLALDRYVDETGGPVVVEVAGGLLAPGWSLAALVAAAAAPLEAVAASHGAQLHVVGLPAHDVATTGALADLGYRIVAATTVVDLLRSGPAAAR